MSDEDSLIREVNEAVRQEQWQRIWQNFSRYILTATALIVVATVGYVLWERHVFSRYESTTEALHNAIELVESGKSYQAREAFEQLATSDDASFAMFAEMWLVKLKYMAGKPDEAQEMSAVSREKYASLGVYQDWLRLYQPVTEEQDDANAFWHTNMERLAVNHLKNDAMKDAAAIYARLAQDSATPSSMRTRANFILSTHLSAFRPSISALQVNVEEEPLETEQNHSQESAQ